MHGDANNMSKVACPCVLLNVIHSGVGDSVESVFWTPSHPKNNRILVNI